MKQSETSENSITLIGTLVSLETELFNFTETTDKIIEAVWIPTMGAMAGWGCDMVINAFKKKPLQMLTNF